MLARNVACGQPEQARQDLADLVRVAVDRLLAEHDEVGLLALDDGLEDARDAVGVEGGVLGAHEDGAVGAHGQHAAQLLRDVLGADAHDDDLADALAALALLGEAQRRLDGVLVERVDLPARGRQVDLAAPELQLLLGVRHPLGGDQDFHVLHATSARADAINVP